MSEKIYYFTYFIQGFSPYTGNYGPERKHILAYYRPCSVRKQRNLEFKQNCNT